MPRSESTSEFQPLEDKEVEYFFASDASAVIEHTNRVIFLEVGANPRTQCDVALNFNSASSASGKLKCRVAFVAGR